MASSMARVLRSGVIVTLATQGTSTRVRGRASVSLSGMMGATMRGTLLVASPMDMESTTLLILR